MRLIGLPMSDHTLVSPENPLGWSPWVANTDRAIERVAKCDELVKSGRFVGVYLSGGCGKLAGPRPCGEYQNGETAYTYWAGHDDCPIHPIVKMFSDLMPTTVSIGFPVTMDGLDYLRADIAQFDGVSFVLDVSGSNTSERVPACVKVIRACLNAVYHESRPIGEPVYYDAFYATMVSRARAIAGRGGSVGDDRSKDIIIYTGGKNRWIEPEAMSYESNGHVVVQPWGTIPLDGGTGGGV